MAGTKSRYVPALDGLRALAVLSVIAYHMSMSWAPGGLLGVTMFFVLSGYLITGLLLKEYDDTGTISLKNFWLRRVRRIIPAVVFAVLGIGFLCTIFNHVLLTKMRPDVLPTLLFVNNWWQIVHNVSYFEALGQPSPLTHFWSLAIEEQFYLIWPVILLVCMRFGARKSTMVKGTLVLTVLSALEMIILFDPHGDPSRVYSPDEYVEESNATIDYVVDKYDNAYLIDWYSASSGHSEYFDGDGTHLKPESCKVYAQLIYDAVSPYLMKRTADDKEADVHSTEELEDEVAQYSGGGEG